MFTHVPQKSIHILTFRSFFICFSFSLFCKPDLLKCLVTGFRQLSRPRWSAGVCVLQHIVDSVYTFAQM